MCVFPSVQVNGVQLYGKSRREAITFLKEVPPPFTMVCCRRLFDDGNESLLDEPVVGVSPPEQKVDFSCHSVGYKDNNFCFGKVCFCFPFVVWSRLFNSLKQHFLKYICSYTSRFCTQLSYTATFGLVSDCWCFGERWFMFAAVLLLLQFIQVGDEKLHCTINTR